MERSTLMVDRRDLSSSKLYRSSRVEFPQRAAPSLCELRQRYVTKTAHMQSRTAGRADRDRGGAAARADRLEMPETLGRHLDDETAGFSEERGDRRDIRRPDGRRGQSRTDRPVGIAA